MLNIDSTTPVGLAEVLSELLEALASARDLVDVNIAAGIAAQQLTSGADA